MSTDSTRPNILLITADQMRADCLSCAGHPVVQTPHLDALADTGVRYNNAYTTDPICVPARLSILTGQYAHAHGVMGNGAMLSPSTGTFVSELQRAGYRTGAIGKMHFWPPHNSFGFDHMELAEQDGPGWQVDEYHSQYLLQHGLIDWWDYWDQHQQFRKQAPQEYWDTFGARGSDIPEEHYHTTWVANRTINYINEADGPFFIWSSFIKPHHPFDPPKPWDTLYNPNMIAQAADQQLALAKPLMTSGGRHDPRRGYFDMTNMSDAAYRKVAAHYYGAISHVDHHVGRILAALDTAGKRQNTLVIFTSDHGDYMGDYGLILKHPNVPYESLVRVPMILSGPGIQAGTVSEALVSLADVAATILPVAAVQTPRYVQGQNLCAQVGESSASSTPRDAVFTETRHIKAVRTQRYKYLYQHNLGIEELYDLASDPKEERNLASDPASAPVKVEMRERLLSWLLDTEWDRYVGPWRMRDLQAKPL